MSPLPSDLSCVDWHHHGTQVCWAAEHTIATASEKDNVVRLYNFDTEDNYVLQVDAAEGTGTMSRIVCLAADNRYGMLAAGASDGRVTVFKYNAPAKAGEPVLDFAKLWETQPAFQVQCVYHCPKWILHHPAPLSYLHVMYCTLKLFCIAALCPYINIVYAWPAAPHSCLHTI